MYNEFYGFSEKPFEGTPDPRFLFLTPSHQEIMSSVIDGVKNRSGFILITGEVGTGKTILIYSLLERFDEKVKTVFIINPSISLKELLKSILLELGQVITEEGKKALLIRLNKYLIEKVAMDETLAVIIDEAQDIPKEVMEELDRLSKLETQTTKRIQIVFVGLPEFEDTLNSQSLRQLKQRIGIRCQVRPLSKEESKEYIEHRLRLVGSKSSEIFTSKAISLICRHVRGAPRLINILCDNALLEGYRLSQKNIDVDIIRKVIKDIESPVQQKTVLFPIVTAVKKFRPGPLRVNISLKRISFVILSLLCLGGLVLLTHKYFQQRFVKTWDIKSSEILYIDAEPSSTSSSPQTRIEGVSKRNNQLKLPEPESAPSKFLYPVSPAPVSLPPMSKEDKLRDVVAVREKQTIYKLARKYYHTANETLRISS